MREQLIRYVELLFAGAENAGDIQQEILQNTLDRYDDLIAQGKTPEAAYRLAISGIGDINEILGSAGGAAPKATGAVPQPVQKGHQCQMIGFLVLRSYGPPDTFFVPALKVEIQPWKIGKHGADAAIARRQVQNFRCKVHIDRLLLPEIIAKRAQENQS